MMKSGCTAYLGKPFVKARDRDKEDYGVDILKIRKPCRSLVKMIAV